MASNPSNIEADRIYEDFQPSMEWKREETTDVLIMDLPGFKKNQLKIQLTSTNVLKISGSQHVSDKKWKRFRVEFPVPSHYDNNAISARFDGGKLHVKIKKLIVPESPLPPQTPKRPIPEPSTKAQIPPPQEKAQSVPPPPPPSPLQPQETPKPPTTEPSPKTQIPPSQPQEKAQPTPLEKAASKKPPPPPPRVEDTLKPLLQTTSATKQPAEEAEVPPKTDAVEDKLQENLVKRKQAEDDQEEKTRQEPGKVSKRLGSRKKEEISNDHLGEKSEDEIRRDYQSSSFNFDMESYKNAIGAWLVELRNAGNLINIVVVILVVLVLGLYVRNAIRSIMKFGN